MKRISHNHGPDEGRGTACGEWPTGHCIIRELTARAEVAEAKVAAVLLAVDKYEYDIPGHGDLIETRHINAALDGTL